MADQLPVQVTECVKYSDLGLYGERWKAFTRTLAPSKYNFARTENCVLIIDLNERKVLSRFPVSDSSIAHLNPTANAVALLEVKKLGSPSNYVTKLKLFNIETFQTIKEFTVNENVTFSKWLDSNTFSFASDKIQLYRWSINDEEQLSHGFSWVSPPLNYRVIDYQVDSAYKWQLVILQAIILDASGDCAKYELNYIDPSGTLKVEDDASVACFMDYKPMTNKNVLTLLCFCTRDGNGAKIQVQLHIRQLGKTTAGDRSFDERIISLPMSDTSDNVVGLHGNKDGIVYVITERGWVYIVDVQTSIRLVSHRMTTETIISTASHELDEQTHGVVLESDKGRALKVCIDETKLVAHVKTELKNSRLAERLTAQFGPRIKKTKTGTRSNSTRLASWFAHRREDRTQTSTSTNTAPAPVQPAAPTGTAAPAAAVSTASASTKPTESKDGLKKQTVVDTIPIDNANGPGNSLLCVVCLEREKKIMVENCHHVCLCVECVDDLFENQEEDETLSCPICRQPIMGLTVAFV